MAQDQVVGVARVSRGLTWGPFAVRVDRLGSVSALETEAELAFSV